MKYEHRILIDWPGELRLPNVRRQDTFRATWGTTVDDLERELHHLNARDIVLETAHGDADLRLDGTLRSDAGRPRHPGVILSFESRYGPLRYFTDVYHEWRANVRAVTLGLEALRAVDRYGVTSRGEQYTGWKKLPPGQGAGHGTAPAMTPDLARKTIAKLAGLHEAALVGAEPDVLAMTYRMAARRVHPDASDGKRELWDQLERARDVLSVAK